MYGYVVCMSYVLEEYSSTTYLIVLQYVNTLVCGLRHCESGYSTAGGSGTIFSFTVSFRSTIRDINFTNLTSALLSQFVAEFYLYGLLIFELQRAHFSNNPFNEYYILDNED